MLSMTSDLQGSLNVQFKQRNDKLAGARGYVRGFPTLMQLLALNGDLTDFLSIYLCIISSPVCSFLCTPLYSIFSCLFYSMYPNINVR